MRDRGQRRSGAADNPRPEEAASASGGGLLGDWVRKTLFGSIIGAALVACLVAWFRGVFDSALADIAPSGADTYCALRETVTNSWPFADPPKPSDRFTILIATIDQDDAAHTYTYAVARAFLTQQGIRGIQTCRVLRLSGVGPEAGIKAVNTAREWLRQRDADLLIGGRLLKKDDAVDLWFVGTGAGYDFLARPFRLDANQLKDDFKEAASAQLLGVALAAVKPATVEGGKYLVETLRPVTERLRHLLRDAAGYSEDERAQLQDALGRGLLAVGGQSGDRQALVDAAASFRAALTEGRRKRVPLQWAATQNNLGSVLWTLGDGDSDAARLNEAAAAYRKALTELTLARAPLERAVTTTSLGVALASLGARENGTVRLKEAIDAYGEALKVLTRRETPLDWAMAQNSLGAALASLGARESGTDRLKEAIEAYGEAQKVLTRQEAPLDWAGTQINLCDALKKLGERENSPARLEEAVAACGEALTELTPERAPSYWGMAQINLGSALESLGERDNGTQRLEQAVAAYQAALTEWTREPAPLYWAQTQENLAIAFGGLALRTTGDARLAYLADALNAVDGALQVYRAGSAAYYLEKAERLRARILAERQRVPTPGR